MEEFFGFLLVVLVVITVIKLFMLTGRPREDEVIERWSAHIPGQSTVGDEFMLQVENELAERNPSFQQSQTSFTDGMGSAGQPAIKVNYNSVYSCFISYETVGQDLCLNYALHQKSSILYAIPIFGPLFYRWMNVIYLHERNKLIAFTSVTIDCARKVADNIVEELGIDKDSVKIKEASGVLGPL